MYERQCISQAVTKVLNGAEKVGIDYTQALGFFERADWELILTEVYGPKQVEHLLQYIVGDCERLESKR